MLGLTADEVLRLLRSLLPEELARGGGHRETTPDPAAISADTRLDDNTVRADSLDRLNLASTLNRLFSLHETGIEDRLLAVRRIGDMAELIAEASAYTNGLVFHTSGSTSDPQPHRHPWAAIAQEGEVLAKHFAGHRRVLAWLPLHHVYGFMFGIALPRALGCEVVDSPSAPPALFHEPRKDDLIVTVPARWRYLLDAGHRFRGGGGVSSTAPLEASTQQGLLEAGLQALAEIYGATETGGIGIRWAPSSAYTLMPHWRRDADSNLERTLPDGSALTVTPLDRLDWLDERTFSPQGRIDDIVQIGGVNVSPTHVAEQIERHDQVAEAAVRPFGEGSQRRLKAFIVPATPGADPSEPREMLEKWLWQQLPAAERPVRLSFGSKLPRNSMGKLQDWD
ncbi:MAG: 4-coumarate--CoA ligase [Halorhodospira sp.]